MNAVQFLLEDLPLEDIGMVEVPNSSNIIEVGYYEEGNMLQVRFVRGRWYRYFGVPKEVWEKLIAVLKSGESVGKWININVAPVYEYKKFAMEAK